MFEDSIVKPRFYWREKLSGSAINFQGCDTLLVGYPNPEIGGETEVSIIRSRFMSDPRVYVGQTNDMFGRQGISAPEEVIDEVVKVLEDKGFKRLTI